MLRNAFTPPCGFDISNTTVGGNDRLSDIAYWGYRLVVHPNGSCFVHETYYDKREGLLGIAREPARPCGDSVDEVRSELERMEEGLAEPAIRFLDFASPDAPAGAAGDGSSGSPPLAA